MPPGEFSKRPLQGRPPLPRHRTSIDGISPMAVRRSSSPRPASSFAARRQYTEPIQAPKPQAQPIVGSASESAEPPAPAPISVPALASAPPEDTDDDELFQSLSPDQDVPYEAKPAHESEKPREPQPPVDVNPEPAVPAEEVVAERPPKPPRAKKRWLRTLLKIFFVLLIAVIFAAAAFFGLRYEQNRNSPTTIFNSALASALSTSQLETQTTVGSNSSDVSLDFSVPTNILASNKAKVNLAGVPVAINGYGSAKSTYVSYQQLPAGAPAKLTSAAQNAWVQLRANGTLPAGVSATLTNVSDPRYLAVGPIIFGNFLEKNSKQLINYVSSHNIYNYDPKKVTHTTKDGTSVLAYPVTLAIGDLKILNDSATSSEGFNPGDVQAAVNKFDAYKGATVTIYIASSTHQFTGINIALSSGQTISIRYTNVDHVSLPAEPQTKLTWATFAGTQQQIEAQAAASQTPDQIDALRASKLAVIHSYLATYFADNNAYPTYTQLNDPTWVQNNMAGLDPDAFHDPLATTLTLSATPVKNGFAYLPLAADGKTVCDNLTQNCSHYSLVATLSSSKPNIVHDP